jgi:hypothetical protein
MRTESTMTIVFAMILVIAIAFLCARGCVGCRQVMAKKFGGTVTYQLDPGTKLVNCTWKESEFWMLTATRPTNEVPKEYQFVEKSLMGVLQGKVIIKEQ